MMKAGVITVGIITGLILFYFVFSYAIFRRRLDDVCNKTFEILRKMIKNLQLKTRYMELAKETGKDGDVVNNKHHWYNKLL